MSETIRTPLVVYIVHHPECRRAEQLASQLFAWFRLSEMAGDAAGAGLPVYYRRKLNGNKIFPRIDFDGAELNVVIALVDHRVVGEENWRAAMEQLAEDASDVRRDEKSQHTAGDQRHCSVLLLPAAMHDSFYRMNKLYKGFNPIRLLDLADEEMFATIRRASSEAMARALRTPPKAETPPPLDVFLSHAKRDGMPIAECIRDSVRKFGQLEAWYDANDLPYGAAWKSPMEKAAENDTAALIATVTDAYPTRPWCRREAKLARTPRPVNPRDEALTADHAECRVWKVQPVVAVHSPGPGWVRGVPMLQGVPRMGWDHGTAEANTPRIVDRLVLEVLLGLVHRRVALDLERKYGDDTTCFITWVPDAWTLAVLRKRLRGQHRQIRKIVYPGHGLTTAEVEELRPVVESFHKKAKLMSYEEAWS